MHSLYSLRGIRFSGGNYCRGKFYGEGAIVPGAILLGGQLSGGNFTREPLSGGVGDNYSEGNFPRGQLP